MKAVIKHISLWQKSGTITNPETIKPSKNKAANAEALRLMRPMQKFSVRHYTPKKHNIRHTLPITFKEPGATSVKDDKE